MQVVTKLLQRLEGQTEFVGRFIEIREGEEAYNKVSKKKYKLEFSIGCSVYDKNKVLSV